MRRLSLLLLLLPAQARAHVKWFVPTGQGLTPDYPTFALNEPAVLLWLVLAAALVSTSWWLDPRLPAPMRPRWLDQTLTGLLPFGMGIALLLTAMSGAVLAPHHQWQGRSADILLLLEALAGALLLFPPLIFAGALVLLAVWTGLLLQAGLPDALEYCNVVGIAGFMALSHHPLAAWRQRYSRWALPLLRVSTGLALLVLAFTEKLLRPDYAESFVQTYMWNFMQNLGVEFYTDRLFVLSAGSVEAVLGLLLILGTTTRLAVLVASAFMLTSNLTFLLQGEREEALLEIIGHLPIICTALILLVFGNPQRQHHGLPLQHPDAAPTSATP
jgi:uncharacterized membrane protein YphA (DoxX/SURF4 family)